jgi:biotin-(acetyl-CoA-carboxylase) ligase
VWLKWPNDFYLNDRKIGGVITNKIGEIYVCGMGINLEKAPEFGDILDVKITPNELVNGFFNLLEQKISWKRIFSKYLIEFELSKKFNSHIDDKIISLKDAILCDDGSIKVGSERVYSLR